ncbi:glycosyltransferase family 2 protein [Oceanisphaera ostreae]|uniref:Glycosyltransferase family 2 protein n=1 Tax=Oceanisphaera ostreae TaxID=914151 RepID=A0ABW3KDT5_9GAMM
MSTSQIFVSVIIPTYHDWDRLQLCINGLSVQSYNQSWFEVIVVNNAPDDINADFIVPENAVVIDEDKPGSYAARNAALKIAKGDVVAFLDSDCIPDSKWLEEGVKALTSSDKVERVAGKVELFFTGYPLSAAECYEKGFAFRQESNVNKGVSVTANLFVYRQLFEQYGMFDDSLLSGGDFEWNRRASVAGSSIVYSSAAIVRHPARNSLSELLKKANRVALGSVAINKKTDKLARFRQVVDVAINDLASLLRRPDMSFKEKVFAVFVWGYIKLFKLFKYIKVKARFN